MVKPAAIIAIAALAAPVVAQDTIDISGLESWGLDGDLQNQNAVFFPGPLDPDLGYIILQIDYDITIQTFGDSWLSDVNVRFGNSDGSFHGSWPDVFTPGAGADYSGVQRFAGSFMTDIHINADGEFHVELFESFDDNPGALDAYIMPGSTMTFGRFIPAPSATATLAVAALGVGTRRRR